MTPTEWRKAEKLTQQDLADELGCTNAAISRYEAGKRPWPIPLAKRLVALAGGRVTIEECYGLAPPDRAGAPAEAEMPR